MNRDRRLQKLALFALFTAALCAFERDAHALGAVDIEGGARVGVATNPTSNGVNPFGFGLGVRAGLSIVNIYGGVSYIHYFGVTKESTVGATTVSLSSSSSLLGAELGYSITGLPLLILRPQLGVGNASFSAGDVSSNYLYLEPGVTVLVPLALLYVGADANLLAIPGVNQGNGETKTYTSLSIHGQIGLRF